MHPFIGPVAKAGTDLVQPMLTGRKYAERVNQFYRMAGYLDSRHLGAGLRSGIGSVAVCYCLLPLTMLSRAGGFETPLSKFVVAFASGSASLFTLLWVQRWPSHRRSLRFICAADVSACMICMSYSNHVYGLIGCTTFALLGNYIAFFHSARLQVAHFLISSTTATILLIRTLTAGQAPAVVIIDIYLVMVISVFALSFNAQINIHYLSIDLDESEIDPLCGLLDRRGFQRHFDTMMLAARENTKPDLSVTMIDLDKFKSLNDSRGHAAGDKALHAVAAIISDLEQDGALSARIGGEEFIIAEFGHATHAVRRASTLCREIAALDCGITASVGVASVPAPSSTPSDSRAFVQSLIASADSAMYEAKRAGGDRVAQALTPGEI